MTDKKIKESKTRGAKRKLQLTNEDLIIIEELAGKKFTQAQMAAYFGISETTWYDSIKDRPDIPAIIARGKAKMRSLVVGKLFELVEEGQYNAIALCLKNDKEFHQCERCEERSNDTESKQDKMVQINVTDPIEAARIYQKIMQGDK